MVRQDNKIRFDASIKLVYMAGAYKTYLQQPEGKLHKK